MSFLITLLNNLLCAMPFCMGMLGIGAMGGLLVYAVSRQWKPQTQTQKQQQAKNLEIKVQAMHGQLRAWQPGALADLSTNWDANWSRWGRDLKAQGTIPGIEEPKALGWVAFAFHLRGAFNPEGALHARTSSHSFEYRLSRDGVSIQVDHAQFGQWNPDGQLLDAEGNAIGKALRPDGMPAMFRVGGVEVLRDKRQRSYPVILNGRTIGELSNPSVQMFNVISLKKPVYAPAVRSAESLSEQEGTWLLALAILQVAGFNVLESVWTN